MVTSVAYAQNNTIDGVTVYCDGVPIPSAGNQFGLACVAFETAAGNQIRNVVVQNASAGIVQTAVQNNNMTSQEPNIFENIRNIGTMTAEAIRVDAGASSASFSRNIIRNVNLKTDLSNPFRTDYVRTYAIRAVASGSSNHFLKVVDSTFEIPANSSSWFSLNQIPKLSFENVTVQDNGVSVATRFIHSESSTVPQQLGVENVYQFYGQEPLNVSTAFEFLDQTALIVSKISDLGFQQSNSTTLFSSAQPSYPAAANWHTNIRVERISKVAGSHLGWTAVGGDWKTYGSISA
jgi:hypothetical protein